MCDGCREIFRKYKNVIRGAALTNVNRFLETDELISQINFKFFSWKKNQVGEIRVNNSFFYTIAKNSVINEFNKNKNISFEDHEILSETVKFGEELNDLEKKYLVDQVLMNLKPDERDAFISVMINEKVSEFSERNNISKHNTAIKRRRRAVEAVKKRINSAENRRRVKNG